jgi:predicted amidophosphoribosyltransferase
MRYFKTKYNPEENAEVLVKYCPNCVNELEIDAIFCPKCGIKIKEV